MLPIAKTTISIAGFSVLLACGAGKIDSPAAPSASSKTSTSTATFTGKSEQASSNANNTVCTSEDDCPAANMDVVSDFFTQGGLVGYVGEPVNWVLKGVDRNSKDRRVGILLNHIPEGARLTPNDTVETAATIAWSAKSPLKSTQKLEIYMRDLDRCALLESEQDYCQAYTFLKAYDQRVELDWQVINRPGATQTATQTSTATSPNAVSVGAAPSGASGGTAATASNPLGSLGSLGSLAGGLGGTSGSLGFLSQFIGSGSGLGSAGSSLGALGALGSIASGSGSSSSSP